MKNKKRVVVAGFGDTGLLVAIHLHKDAHIVGISPKPCLVSGQELGTRLTQPLKWKKDYLMPYSRYRGLRQAEIHQGLITGVDTEQQEVRVTLHSGREIIEPYDVLLLSSGVSNGFWRNALLEDQDSIVRKLQAQSEQLLAARSVAIIGGGATGVSVAANVAQLHPTKTVNLYFSQDEPLPGYHPDTRRTIQNKLKALGVNLFPGHRAMIANDFDCDTMSHGTVSWATGQSDSTADVTLWAVGRLKPNNQFIPKDMLDDQGFVRCDPYLRVTGHDNVFTVGDIAATDANRSSARNWGFRLAANNIRAYLTDRPEKMKSFKASDYRWGSILGVQRNGLRVFQPDGTSFRFPTWAVELILFPVIVRRVIYRGVRNRTPAE